MGAAAIVGIVVAPMLGACGSTSTSAGLSSSRQCHVAQGFGTDSQIKTLNLHILTDDKGALPSDSFSLAVRTPTLTKYSVIKSASAAITSVFTTDDSIALQALVTPTSPAPAVAQKYVTDKGLAGQVSGHVTGSINVGYENFSENQLMAEMLKAILSAHGLTVTLQQFTDSPDVRAALKSGQVDAYWEYLGTGEEDIFGLTTFVAEPTAAVTKLNELDTANSISWLPAPRSGRVRAPPLVSIRTS